MPDPGRELTLDDLPRPPFFKLVQADGRDAAQRTEVGGEGATVAALFSDRELAGEFSAGAPSHGMETLAGADPRELPDWVAVENFALSGTDYVLLVSGDGVGLFHAGDVARKAAERAGEIPFPLYVIAYENGEAPLITVEVDGGEVLISTLFGSPEGARLFRENAAHLNLPESLGTIEDAEGLSRHALVARQAGAEYAVVDPESGLTEAMPIEELI